MSSYNKEKVYYIQTPIKFWYRQDIIWLQNQPDGYEILTLYNKLMGLTANMNGFLLKEFGNVVEPYTNEEIAKITMHDIEIVNKGLEMLENIGLIEKVDNNYFIEEALNMTNQTKGAKKKQIQRSNKKDKCPPECPPESPSDCPPYTYTQSYTKTNTKTNKKKEKTKSNIEIKINEETGEIIESELLTNEDIIYKNIIDYLNLRLDTHYRYTSNKTRTLINARLNEGFTEEDFKVVIDKKYLEWHDSDMQQYLRPETLFGNKFESYLNQMAVEKKKTLKDVSMAELEMALQKERENKESGDNDVIVGIY